MSSTDLLGNFVYDILNYLFTGLIFLVLFFLHLIPIFISLPQKDSESLLKILDNINKSTSNLTFIYLCTTILIAIFIRFLFFSIADVLFKKLYRLMPKLIEDDADTKKIKKFLIEQQFILDSTKDNEDLKKILDSNKTKDILLKKISLNSKYQSKFAEWYKFKEHFFKILSSELFILFILYLLFAYDFRIPTLLRVSITILDLVAMLLLINISNYYKNRNKTDFLYSQLITLLYKNKELKSEDTPKIDIPSIMKEEFSS